jgi:hypothetical protein
MSASKRKKSTMNHDTNAGDGLKGLFLGNRSDMDTIHHSSIGINEKKGLGIIGKSGWLS